MVHGAKLALALCISAIAGGAFAADASLIAAAKKEGQVVWYTSTPIETAQKIAKLFETETAIKVEMFRSGGSAILATDQAEQEGLDAAPLPPHLVGAVTPLIPPHAIKTNPIDLTGDANAKMFGEVIKATRDHYDTLGVIFGDPIVDSSEVVTPGSNELIIYLGGAEVERRERELMHLKGIPVFPTPERGVKALARLIGRKGLAPPQRPTLTTAAAGRQLARGERAPGHDVLDRRQRRRRPSHRRPQARIRRKGRRTGRRRP